jgi:hypothetical protein
MFKILRTLFVSSRKNRERRENVISELVVTEREFCRDLKLTWQAFGLDTPAMLEQRGIIFEIKSSVLKKLNRLMGAIQTVRDTILSHIRPVVPKHFQCVDHLKYLSAP